jgi:hypothetical protein
MRWRICCPARQPNSLAACRCHRDVLSLAGGQRDDLLLLGLPGDGTIAEEEQHAGGALPSIDVVRHVTVDDPVSSSAAIPRRG